MAASRITTGIAAGVLVIGLLATFALPHSPVETGGGAEKAQGRTRRRRQAAAADQP